MRNLELVRYRDRLNNVFTATAALAPGSTEQVHLVRYLCVQVAGLLEQSVRHLYYDHARNRSQPTVAQFVSRRLLRPMNMDSERLCNVAGEFSRAWRDRLETFLDEEHKSAVNSVITNRNRIAHGETTSFGLADLRQWYKNVIEVVECIEDFTA